MGHANFRKEMIEAIVGEPEGPLKRECDACHKIQTGRCDISLGPELKNLDLILLRDSRKRSYF